MRPSGHCAHAAWYWCVTCGGLRWPGHACTYITWTSQPYQVTCGHGGGAGSGALTQGAAGGPGLTTYTLC